MTLETSGHVPHIESPDEKADAIIETFCPPVTNPSSQKEHP
jgi:pimeloyl-ACP methyl ester carboxylesterase